MIADKKLKSLYETFLAESTSVEKKMVEESPIEKIPYSLKEPLNNFIDHTLLKPEATLAQIEGLCREAREFAFKTVCVQPMYVADCVRFLVESQVLPITVVGFPFGANTTDTKVFEAKTAIEDGAKEIDMVWNISAVKSEMWDLVYKDVHAVVEACGKIPVKVIVETSSLTHDEKVFACACVQAAGAAFIKTSTGFAQHGAQLEDVYLFKHLLKNSIKIKASGGIKSAEQAKEFLAAGASRLGTSSGVEIMKNTISKKDY
jgi:deoxyribose-phosphate aldolase